MKRLARFLVILPICLATDAGDHARAAEQQPVAVRNPMKVDPGDYLERISLPPGFRISLYATGVPHARSMAIAPGGTLFVGTFGEWRKEPHGKVYALRDQDGDSVAEQVTVVASDLNYPNGVALHEGDLYVAEISRILRYDDIEAHLADPPEPVVVYDDFPSEMHHGWKFIRFGPDGKLYVPVGAPCNICEPAPPFAGITRMNADGSGFEIYARGIRNSVGFDWDPRTGELWFTDNGRDLWGNERPPEELNHAPRAGLHFGYPYRYGKNLVDDAFATSMTDADFQPAALEIPPHRAAIGMRFYTGASFPETYRNRIFIAQHGSWNRSPPDGYSVAVVRLEDNRPVAYEDFASGWLIEDRHWGRPVDVEILGDGSLLVSDDHNGCIYRISYQP
jgi:glucose/arabinose dehydrogenase